MRLTTPDKVRELQRKLYRKSKAEPHVRFYTLWDKVCRRDVLETAWQRVKENKGACGIDGETIQSIEADGLVGFLSELQTILKSKTYKPMPVRRVWIPKANNGKRPLGIPAVRDRVVQMAVKIVLEPILEATFQEFSYGFRPKRSAHDAVEEVGRYLRRGLTRVVDADIRDFFGQIPHRRLIEVIARKVADGQILRVIHQWLKCGVLEEGKIRYETTGTPQGGVISPLLANAYLNELDRRWLESGMTSQSPNAQVVRYADDLVVLTNKDPKTALETLRRFLGDLGLELHPDKTRLVDANTGSFDFLGFNFRKTLNFRSGKRFPLMQPTKKAQERMRQKIRELTRRERTKKVQEVVREINPVIRGWVQYFRIGHSSKAFSAMRDYVEHRVLRYVRRKQLLRGCGWKRYPAKIVYGKWGLFYDYRVRRRPVAAKVEPKGLR